MYTYIYIHTHIFIYTYTHICTCIYTGARAKARGSVSGGPGVSTRTSVSTRTRGQCDQLVLECIDGAMCQGRPRHIPSHWRGCSFSSRVSPLSSLHSTRSFLHFPPPSVFVFSLFLSSLLSCLARPLTRRRPGDSSTGSTYGGGQVTATDQVTAAQEAATVEGPIVYIVCTAVSCAPQCAGLCILLCRLLCSSLCSVALPFSFCVFRLLHHPLPHTQTHLTLTHTQHSHTHAHGYTVWAGCSVSSARV